MFTCRIFSSTAWKALCTVCDPSPFPRSLRLSTSHRLSGRRMKYSRNTHKTQWKYDRKTIEKNEMIPKLLRGNETTKSIRRLRPLGWPAGRSYSMQARTRALGRSKSADASCKTNQKSFRSKKLAHPLSLFLPFAPRFIAQNLNSWGFCSIKLFQYLTFYRNKGWTQWRWKWENNV